MDDITYIGPARYAGIASSVVHDVKPEHTNYQTAPSHFWEISDGTTLHIIAYNTPKSGVKVRCWIKEEI